MSEKLPSTDAVIHFKHFRNQIENISHCIDSLCKTYELRYRIEIIEHLNNRIRELSVSTQHYLRKYECPLD